jgi:LacI family transcriptional regulator
MPTIHDVARLAGVAPITVSRVINNSGYLSQETRERVESAISDLGYVPNTLARSLRSKRTNTLALVLTDITNPFWTTVARGVEDTASDAGFTVFFCNTDESISEEQKYLKALLQKQVDGILLVPAQNTPDSVELIQKQNTPTVILDRQIAGVQADCVRADSRNGSYELTRLLISQGHTRIALLGGPEGVSTANDRREGYRQALSEAGLLKENNPFEFSGKYTYESGYDLTEQVLSCSPSPTALVATNNFIANGAIRALRDHGITVPDYMSVVGFDDIPAAINTIPFLTVVSQPAYEMGKEATRLLLSRLNGEAPDVYKDLVLPVELIVRQSSTAPRED